MEITGVLQSGDATDKSDRNGSGDLPSLPCVLIDDLSLGFFVFCVPPRVLISLPLLLCVLRSSVSGPPLHMKG